MGLSASQGRMLLLTARKSDLEFRAQQISQKRLILAQQLEEVSVAYEEATSNRQMKIRLYSDGTNDNDVTNKTVNLTYATLISGAIELGAAVSGIQGSTKVGTKEMEYTSNAAYRLVDPDGAIVVADESEIPNLGAFKKGADGKYRNNGEIYRVDKCLKYGSTDSNGAIDGPNYLQDALRNGKYLIEKARTDADTKETTWHGISWDATSNISDSYYQDDDDAAKAKYDRLQAQVQSQDKKLELELDNVETQRSAVQTEMDSVDKVMSDNIENTFNAFG